MTFGPFGNGYAMPPRTVAGNPGNTTGPQQAINIDDFAAASHTHAASAIASGVIAPARLGSGTPSSANYLRGDGSWSAVSAGIGGSTGGVDKAIVTASGTGGATVTASGLTANGTTLSAASVADLLIRARPGTDIIFLSGDPGSDVETIRIKSGTQGIAFVNSMQKLSWFGSAELAWAAAGALKVVEGGGNLRDLYLRNLDASGYVKFASIAKSALLAITASAYVGAVYAVSDGRTANELARSDGTNWVYVVDNVTVT